MRERERDRQTERERERERDTQREREREKERGKWDFKYIIKHKGFVSHSFNVSVSLFMWKKHIETTTMV